MIAGNWKMNGSKESLNEIKSLQSLIGKVTCDVAIFPPATLLSEAIKVAEPTQIKIGAQDCHHEISGPHTGEVSAHMLEDLGVEIVILGHSERRLNNNETNSLVNQKAASAHKNNLITIICVGESEDQKLSGQTTQVITDQLVESLPQSATQNNTIIAYEPIWAIGTGKIASPLEIVTVHAMIKDTLFKIKRTRSATELRILYGGSVNGKNCSEILHLAGVDGALVGGASLSSLDFSEIIKCA